MAGRGGSVSGQSHRIRSALVITQMALALILLVGAGLMTRSFLHLQNANPGLDPAHVLTFRVGLPSTQFKDETEIRTFWRVLLDRLREIPGVEEAGMTGFVPVSNNFNRSSFHVEGRPYPKSLNDSPHSLHRTASPGALEALKIPLLRGRLFNAGDTYDSAPVILVDQAFADKFFPGEDALGKRISSDEPDDPKKKWATIVGIVGNGRQRATVREPEMSFWSASAQEMENFATAVLRVKGDPMTYQRAAQAAVLAAKADIPIYTVRPMEQVVTESVWPQRFFGQLFMIYAGLALFLASIGIYGVMSYSVAQRTQEIGVRMALGAEPGEVVRMVLRQGMKLVAVGLGIGFVGAWLVAQALASQLYGVHPHDPPTFTLVPLLLAAVALLACWIPSRRATRVPPVAALRAD